MGDRELKKQYNSLLDRYNKANEWFNDETRTVEEQDKHFNSYRKLIKQLAKTADQLEKLGVKVKYESPFFL